MSEKSLNKLNNIEKIGNFSKRFGNNVYMHSKSFLHNAFNPASPFPLTDINMEVKQPPRYNTLTSGQGPTYPRDDRGLQYEIQPYNYRQILDICKRCPEVLGIIHAIITDIVSDGYRFETADGSEGGRNKIKKAINFCKKNLFKQEFKATLQDWLIVGDGALWKGKISLVQLKELDTKGVLEEKEYKQIINDEDAVKSIKHVSWSTMKLKMDSDNTYISQFIHQVQGFNDIEYDPSEIIHGKYMDWEGKAYGYSPVIAGLAILSSLNMIKDINGSFFEKGGVPDWIFNLPKEQANSSTHKLWIQTIKEYQSSTQKHGSIVTTGEMMEPKQLNKFDKDMEFRQHAIYLTGVLALSYNIPLSRVASVIGTEAKSGSRAEDASLEAYWGKISEHQDYWELLLNTQLFEPHFGVSIKFNRFYKNNEIKETQANLQHLELLNRVYATGMIKGNKPEFAYNLLKIPVKYRSDKEFIPYGAMGDYGVTPGQPGGGPAPMNQPGVMEGPAQNKMRTEKRDEQNAKKPGFATKEYKEVLPMSFEEFKKLKNKLETRKPMGMSGITYYTLVNGLYIIHYATPDFKHRIEVLKSSISKVDEIQYILKDGVQVYGLLGNITRPEVV